MSSYQGENLCINVKEDEITCDLTGCKCILETIEFGTEEMIDCRRYEE